METKSDNGEVCAVDSRLSNEVENVPHMSHTFASLEGILQIGLQQDNNVY